MDENKTSCILGFVPSRRNIGLVVLNESELKYYKVLSLRRFSHDGKKILVANKHLCSLMNHFKPRAIVTLKLSPQRATKFNLNLVSFLKGLADSRLCPVYYLDIGEVKKLLRNGSKIKNQRQLAGKMAGIYPELANYLPDKSSRVIKYREKYYQPLFTAIGLVRSYLKLISNENEGS